jgi:MSHA pilin protein MshA
MNPFRHRARKGFSLVELLAVVLILSVLAASAIPLYMNTRKVAAARACKGNIAAIAAAESAYVLRYGKYTNMAGLLTSAESLSSTPSCPLDASAYTITTGGLPGTAVTLYVPASDTGGTTAAITIACPNAGTATTGHLGAQGAPSLVTDWQRSMAAIVTDSIP